MVLRKNAIKRDSVYVCALAYSSMFVCVCSFLAAKHNDVRAFC